MVDLDELITVPRKEAKSLAELSPWFGMAADDVVICNDGTLIAGYEFEGLSMEGVDDESLNAQIEMLQRSFRGISDRITIMSFLDRRKFTSYNPSDYVNPVARKIDEAWGKSLTKFPHAFLRHQIFVTYRFNDASFAFFEAVRMEMEDDANIFQALARVLKKQMSARGTIASIQGQLTEMYGDFSQTLSAFEAITGPRLGFVRLSGEFLLGALYARLNLASPAGPVMVPNRPCYLAQTLAADNLVRKGNMLEFTGPSKTVYVSALATTEMPKELYSFYIDQLLGVDCEFTLCQVFSFLDHSVAQKEIQSAEQYYKMEVKSLLTRVAERITKENIDKVNTGYLNLAQDAQDALAELTASDVSYGYYSMTILGIGETPAHTNRSLELISGSLRANGFTVTREVTGLMSSFLATLPGNGRTSIRKYLASTANVSDIVPLRTIRTGNPSHPLFGSVLGREVASHVTFPTASGVPYDFSTHEMDLGHAAIIGGSGAGKTTLMHLMISMFQKYHPCNTFIFDKDYSMSVLTLLLGGRHIDMATRAGRRVGMNPIKRMLANNDDLVLRKWLEVLICAGDPDSRLANTENEDLYVAIQQVKGLGPAFWRLGQIYAHIKGRNPELAHKLAAYIDRSEDETDMTRKGPFSDFFDNEDDAFELTTIVGMETGALLLTPEVASPFMDYAFYCIEQRLDGNTPTMIYVEEAWYMLSNPVFAAKMDDWLRTFRKKKAFLVFATQALDEIRQMKSVGAFISNVPTRIFLPSINNSVAANADLYRDIFSLNDAQLDLLSSALPKRDYLLVKSGETRLVEAEMPSIIIKINDATARTNYRELAMKMAEDNELGWQERYLKEILNVPDL